MYDYAINMFFDLLDQGGQNSSLADIWFVLTFKSNVLTLDTIRFQGISRKGMFDWMNTVYNFWNIGGNNITVLKLLNVFNFISLSLLHNLETYLIYKVVIHV